MATFVGYTVHVAALQDRDLDDQAEQLESLPHVSEVEFVGVPGGGSYFAVTIAAEPPRPMQAMLNRCDQLVRRAHTGNWDDSQCLALASRAAWSLLGK